MSMAVIIAVNPLEGSSNGTISICKASSGPIASLEVSIIGGVRRRLSVRFVCTHFMHWLMCLAIFAAKPG